MKTDDVDVKESFYLQTNDDDEKTGEISSYVDVFFGGATYEKAEFPRPDFLLKISLKILYLKTAKPTKHSVGLHGVDTPYTETYRISDIACFEKEYGGDFGD